MALSFVLVGPLVLAAAALSGCKVTIPHEQDGYMVDIDADTVRVEEAAKEARTAPDGRPYQFRAVCLADEHPGPAHVLSKWVEDPSVARELGQYHGEFKAKGHEWRIERRVHRGDSARAQSNERN